MTSRRPRWVLVLACAVLVWLAWMLAGALLAEHVEGRFVATRAKPASLTRKHCETYGTWRSADGTRVLQDVAYDGMCLDVGEERTAYRWEARWVVLPGQDENIVHSGTSELDAVLVTTGLGAVIVWFVWAQRGR